MKYKSCCPKCDKPQTRWDFYQPCPGFANQCKGCGTNYKSNKFSSFIGVCIGLTIAGSFISADKDFITWQVALIITFILLATTAYANPYFTKLVELKESDKNIINKWMLPFLRWQIFIIVFVILLVLANAFALVINHKNLNAGCCTEEKIEKIESVEKLKLVIQSENYLFMSFSELYKSLLELNVFISIFVFIYLMPNLLFYFKVRDSHNNSVKTEAVT
jgi:hypothetical protein